ncbi:MAG TPA: DUF4340 domain-containing protein [Stellaceae bacterium]|jgi:hypothetical protein|nr:DUF4340 domain-containing protein [Stellaceae bacterium]
MRNRGFSLLLGATVLLVAGAIYTLASAPRPAEPVAADTKVFPDLAAKLGDLTWMRLLHGGTKIDFAQIGNRWVVVEKGNYPAAAAKIRQLLLGLADLTLVEPKTTRPELFARLDLDDPNNGKSTQVTLQNRLGNPIAELLIGKTRHDRLGTGSDGVYIRKPGEQSTWLARGSLDLPSDATGWLDRRIIDIPAARITSVALTDPDGAILTLRRDTPGGAFAVADPPADTKFKDDAVLAGPAAVLAGLDLNDVKPRADLPVPDRGASTAKFTTADGLDIELHLFSHDKADWLTIDATTSGALDDGKNGASKNDAVKNDAESKTISAKTRQWVFAIAPDRAKLLRTRLADVVQPAKGS